MRPALRSPTPEHEVAAAPGDLIRGQEIAGAAVQLECHHPTEAAHLPRGNGVILVGLQAGVEHPADRRMIGQEAGDLHGVAFAAVGHAGNADQLAEVFPAFEVTSVKNYLSLKYP